MWVGFKICFGLNDDYLFASELIKHLKAIFFILQYLYEDTDTAILPLLLVHLLSVTLSDNPEVNLFLKIVREDNQLTIHQLFLLGPRFGFVTFFTKDLEFKTKESLNCKKARNSWILVNIYWKVSVFCVEQEACETFSKISGKIFFQ